MELRRYREPRWNPRLWVALMALAMVASMPSLAAEEMIEDATGTMQKVGSFGYGIVPDDDAGSRYAPSEEVAEEFRVEGLRVVFSGIVGDASEGRGGRRWGTPIELTKLQRLADEEAEGAPEDGDAAAEPADDPSGRSR